MKKYTYKSEIFLCDHTHKASFILGGIFTTAAAIFLLTSGDPDGYIGGILGFAVLGIPGLLVLRLGINSGKKHYKQQQDWRNKMMTAGRRMAGKVVSSGGHRYFEQHKHNNHEEVGRRLTYTILASDWWIEVEYFDTRDNTVKTVKAENMNANGKYLIGMQVDVYLKGTAAYVDIP